MSQVTIRDVRTIMTAPDNINLIVIKVETSEPGLYGLGCATLTYRHHAIRSIVDHDIKPYLIGKDPRKIEDIWQTLMVNAYWRNGPIQNNAISGVDMALWDIKGKMANMPVYELLGGKCREAAAVYRHADGRDGREVEENVRRYMEQGFNHIRCQINGYGGPARKLNAPAPLSPGLYYDPDLYARATVALFDDLRGALGFEVELLHDVHERVAPTEAVRLAKQLEPHRLFFLEDALPPEQTEWFGPIRAQCTTPLAMGELFAHPAEWMPLISRRLIDFIRCHISAIGGITPARKLAVLCEAFGIRTAWHGPGDVSAVGHAANLHLDLSSPNFGIQEWYPFPDSIREVFPGCAEIRNGYAYLNDKPGLGIDLDEALAAKYPCHERPTEWTTVRYPDGTAARP